MSAPAPSPDHAAVRELTRRSRSNFYYSFFFLPRDQRAAIETVYAFCRSVDDAVDTAPDEGTGRERLEWWRRELAACFGDGASPAHVITRDLAEQVERFRLTREPLEEVIRGVEMDLTRHRYESFDDLAVYCRRVASAVGHSCIEIFGSRGEASRRFATTLGLAFQLTNILRDIRSDGRRGRIYLPADELRRFGWSEEDALAGKPGPAFDSLMEFQCGRARDLFRQAARELPPGEERRLMAASIMGAIYGKILEKISRDPGAVLRERVTLSPPRKIAVAVAAFGRARLASGRSPSPA